MKRKLLMGIIAVTIFAFGVGTVAAQSDLSGVWTLDAGKSEGVPPGLIQTMTIMHKDDRIAVETKSKVGEGQERVVKDSYSMDGKENDFTAPIPVSSAKKELSVSKWMEDRNGFDVNEESVLNAPDGGVVKVKSTRRWRLSADGKTLTIEMEVEHSRRGASKSKRVFVKN